MHIADENQSERTREQRLLVALQWALRELAANLMKITRSAGKPQDIVAQTVGLITTVANHQKLTGQPVPLEAFTDALRIQRDLDDLTGFDDSVRERVRATEQVVEGALQFAASRLLGQATHVSRGINEMFDGIHRIRDLNEKERIAREAAIRTPQKAKATAKRKQPAKPPLE